MARVAIVTGGTRGIGEAISVALRDMGMKVAANYAGNDERARQFTDRTGITAYKWDVSDYDACMEGAAKVEAELGPVDVLVNNAGITRDTTMKRMDRDKWQDVIDTNLGGCFNMAKAVFDGMLGRAMAGSSTSARSTARRASTARSITPPPSRGSTVSPGAWQEGARAGVTVNAIAPGYIDTDMVAAVRQVLGDHCENSRQPTRQGRGNRPQERVPVGEDAGLSPVRLCRSTAASTCIDDGIGWLRSAGQAIEC
jgi:acetoacetyl-CoA reductase